MRRLTSRWPLPTLALLLFAACNGASAPVADSPQRIIAVAPNLTETLFVLGLGERVVGVGDYSRWPPEAAEKARVGGLFNARLEEIVALEPDLAVLLPSEAELAAQLRGLGVEVLTVAGDSLDDVERSMLEISRRCGVEQTGRDLAERWRADLQPDPLPGEPRVALVLGRQPGHLGEILVAGPGTFLDELLRRLGAVNVFSDSPLSYPQVGLEQILERQPTALVELQTSPEPMDALLAEWRSIPELDGTCLGGIAGDHVLIPGPRLPSLYGELRQRLVECEVGR